MNFEKLKPRSLQQRTLFYILVPTFALLLGMSTGGYVFLRDMLLNQWGETAIAKLQRTAHQVDMKLRHPKELLEILQGEGASEMTADVLKSILKKAEEFEGVSAVQITWPGELQDSNNSSSSTSSMMGRMGHYWIQKFSMSAPSYNIQLESRTISLIYELKNQKSVDTGRIEVIISFDKLIGEVVKAAWWKSNKAYLVDDQGQILASTVSQEEQQVNAPLFGVGPGLQQDTLRAFQTQNSGMVFGRGTPPEEVSGYYRLMEAPWTMVVMAPGDKVMQPIISFKLVYILSIIVCIVLILLLIRMVTGQVTSKVKDITIAANDLAKGHFGEPLQVISKDEIGELMNSFNSMSRQLRQRLLLKEALGIAREVQQNLLPKSGYSKNGIFINGITLYCDETGGDYYDIITFPDAPGRVAIVVGDVVGHGIGAALLMTTVRAHLRSRIVLDDDLAEVMNAVNYLLCEDTCKTGSFVTLFCLVIDRDKNSVQWVRAGHDPAIVYDIKSQQFTDLKGPGVALGVDPEIEYSSQKMLFHDEKDLLVLLSSDGAWEVENPAGEQFGKERIRKIMSTNCDQQTDVIIDKLVANIVEFKADKQQKDDITLALVKC